MRPYFDLRKVTKSGVNTLLDSLGVPPENVLYDNFGG